MKIPPMQQSKDIPYQLEWSEHHNNSRNSLSNLIFAWIMGLASEVHFLF